MKQSGNKFIYIGCAALLGLVLPLFETFQNNIPESSSGRLPETADAAHEAKVSVVERLPQAEEVTLIPEPEPVRRAGSEFSISARGAVVLDATSGHVLFSKNPDGQVPIASISKLMTAIVVAEMTPDWDRVITMIKDDEAIPGGATKVYRGEDITLKDLWHVSLVRSDNNATLALVRSTGLSREDFVKRMNDTAWRMGLRKTHFVEPTGLSAENVSTPNEVVYLLQQALSKDVIKKAISTPVYTYQTVQGQTRTIESTNELLSDSEIALLGGKTGYTEAAGNCLVSAIQNEDGHLVYTAVLGSTSENNRFEDTKKLASWTFEHWQWPRVAGKKVSSDVGG